MASVTVIFSSVTGKQLRKILVAHKAEFELDSQPSHIATTYVREHDRSVGCIVRVDGTDSYSVTTLPLVPDSAERVVRACKEA